MITLNVRNSKTENPLFHWGPVLSPCRCQNSGAAGGALFSCATRSWWSTRPWGLRVITSTFHQPPMQCYESWSWSPKAGRPWKKNLQPLENKFKGFTPTNPWKKNLIPWKRNLSTQPEPGWRGLGGRAQRLPPRCIRKTCYVIRSQFIEFLGPEDQSTTRPQDQRTTGPEDQRTTGPEDQRTTGPEDHRTRGPNNQRTRGPKDQTARGPQGQRSLNFFSRGCKIFFQGTWIFFPGNVNFFSSIIPPKALSIISFRV